jgi:hypothetical protein
VCTGSVHGRTRRATQQATPRAHARAIAGHGGGGGGGGAGRARGAGAARARPAHPYPGTASRCQEYVGSGADRAGALCLRQRLTCPPPTLSVAVALSGGVDSSVAAHLLRARGYRNLEGWYMRTWDARDQRGAGVPCPSDADYADVQRVCSTLGIPCRVVDLVKVTAFERVPCAPCPPATTHTCV